MAIADKVNLQLNRCGKAVRIVATLKNWPEVFRSILVNYPLTEICRREGITIHAPEGLQLWNHYNDIWEHHTYTSGYGLKNPGVVIDIGANISLFSLFAAKSATAVYCFERLPQNFDYLQKNVLTNNFTNVKCFNLAVCGQGGEKIFHESEHPTAGTLYGGKNSAVFRKANPVKCTTLKEIFDENRIECCDFLKLDCEGCEFEILLNTPAEYLSKIQMISLEFHDYLTEFTHHDLVQYLTKHGFSLEITGANGQVGIMIAKRAFPGIGNESKPS
jgi:FkbM family methyltransferase